MNNLKRYTVAVTTDGSGNATAYTPNFSGYVYSIGYTLGTFSAGVDFALTVDRSTLGLWTEADVNASALRMPRVPVHAIATGLAIAGVADMPLLLNDRVKIAISSGGATKLGTFEVTIIEP